MDSATSERDSRTIPLPTLPHEPLRVNARRPESCPRHTTGRREESRESYRRLQRVPPTGRRLTDLKHPRSPPLLKTFQSFGRPRRARSTAAETQYRVPALIETVPHLAPQGEKTERRRREDGESAEKGKKRRIELLLSRARHPSNSLWVALLPCMSVLLGHIRNDVIFGPVLR